MSSADPESTFRIFDGFMLPHIVLMLIVVAIAISIGIAVPSLTKRCIITIGWMHLACGAYSLTELTIA